jgi:hypothetical protein
LKEWIETHLQEVESALEANHGLAGDVGAELAPHVVAVEVANLSEGRLEVLVLVDADGWEQGVTAGQLENLTGERNSWRLPGPRNLRGSWGGAGHARPVLVRDDAVDSAHGAAAEGGDGGDVRVSARSRFRSCARGAAGSRGGRGASPAPRRKRTPTDGAQSSTGGGICDRTHRPSSRPRPSREKLGNGSIVVMICGGVIDASVARLQPGLRAQTCARGGDQQAGGGRTRLSRQVFPFHVGTGQRESSVHVVGKRISTVELRAA